MNRKLWRGRNVALATVALSAMLATSACGSGTNNDSGSSTDTSTDSASADAGNLPSTVRADAIIPLTGPAAFAGVSAQKGYQLAVKEINAEKALGDGVTFEVEYQDTKGEIQTAASALTSSIADKDVSAVFGSLSSQEAVAQSPLAEKGQLPIIYTQAGSDGVVIGDYTYRATPLMSTYYPIVQKFIEEQGWKSIGIVYTNIAPTLEQVATVTFPAMADELGFTITKSVATTADTQDYSAPIQQVLKTNPDGIAILQIGAANPTAMTQLRQAGYTGKVLGNSGASAGNLKPAGADGAGMVWPTDFDFQQDAASSKKFVDAYKAEFGEDPLNYAAEAYDAAWFLARSIAAADSADRAAIKDALAVEAGKTTDGALGTGLTWKDNTIVTGGVVLEWNGTGADLLYSASDS